MQRQSQLCVDSDIFLYRLIIACISSRMSKKAAVVSSSERATWLETVKSFGELVAGKADGVVNSISSVVAAGWEFFKSPAWSHGDGLIPAEGTGQKNKPKGARKKKSKGVPATFSEVVFAFSEKGWASAAELKASAIESSKLSISRVGAALRRDADEHTAAGLTIALLFFIIIVAGSIYKRRVPRVRARAHAVSRSATDNVVGGGGSANPLSTVAAIPAEPGIETETDPIEVSGRKDAEADLDARDAAPEPLKQTPPSESLGPLAAFEPAQGPTSLSASESGAREPVTPDVSRCQPTAPRKAVPATLVTQVLGDAAADIGNKATELASPAPVNPPVGEEKEEYASVEPRRRAAKVGEAIVDADEHPGNVVEDRAAGYTDDVSAVALVKEEEMQASAPLTVDVATVTPEAGNVIALEISEETLVSFAFLLRLPRVHLLYYPMILVTGA